MAVVGKAQSASDHPAVLVWEAAHHGWDADFSVLAYLVDTCAQAVV